MKRQLQTPSILLALLVAVAACSSVDVTAPEPQVIEETTFAPSLGVTLDSMTVSASGLYYQDIEVGEGPMPEAGDSVLVRYAGYLTNGAQFDARDATFTVGSLIPGFDEGILGMAEGGVRKIVIPPALGYGPTGNPPRIPGGAILVFDLELLEVYPVEAPS